MARRRIIGVERTAWTDERLDDLAARMDAGFARMDARFDRMEARFDAKFDSLNATLLRIGGAMIVTLLGVIAAILARGA
jgi:hypothetical protein